MKIKLPVITECDIHLIRISAEVAYEEEEIPNDFPGRTGEIWKAEVEIDTGKIRNWPAGRAEKMHLTVKDSGSYVLVDVSGRELASRDQNYVPHGVIPGSYGDTIELEIAADGTITNWPKKPTFEQFFERGD